jgi:hypothetical protein
LWSFSFDLRRFGMANALKYNVAASEKQPQIIEIAKGLKDIPMCEDYEKMVSGML